MQQRFQCRDHILLKECAGKVGLGVLERIETVQDLHVFVPDQKTGEIVPVLVHNFKDGHGELRFAWHSPKLDRGLGKAPVGAEVAILWLGKEKLDAVRTINTFRVAIKPPTV